MPEIWKDIEGYKGIYKVSNYGRVKSYNRSKRHSLDKSHFLKPTVCNHGYEEITLYKNTKRQKFLVHRLVAQYFLENPHNYPCINHKDENKLNNRFDNLEWCSYQYNNSYGTARIRMIEKEAYGVDQFTISGHWIATYVSVGTASRLLNIPVHSIRDCCRGVCSTAYGYKWEYPKTATQSCVQ